MLVTCRTLTPLIWSIIAARGPPAPRRLGPGTRRRRSAGWCTPGRGRRSRRRRSSPGSSEARGWAALAMPPVSSSLTACEQHHRAVRYRRQGGERVVVGLVSMPSVSTSMMWLFGSARVDRSQRPRRRPCSARAWPRRTRLGAPERSTGPCPGSCFLACVGHVEAGVLLGVEGVQADLRRARAASAPTIATRRDLGSFRISAMAGWYGASTWKSTKPLILLVDQRLQVADGHRAVQVVDRLHDRRAAHALAAACSSPWLRLTANGWLSEKTS